MSDILDELKALEEEEIANGLDMTAQEEYIVTLKKDADATDFHDKMIRDSASLSDTGQIPTRTIDTVNRREKSNCNTHYSMSLEEVRELRKDPRVDDVQIPFENDPHQNIGLCHYRGTQGAVGWAPTDMNFDRSPSQAWDVNWGLRSMTTTAGGWNSNSTELTGKYGYNLTGKGVDVIIQDTGIIGDHPEFAINPDGTGGSRYDSTYHWWNALGINMPGGYSYDGYHNDSYGHGSHVAGIAVGNTCGWATEAGIWSQKIQDAAYVSHAYSFDMIEAFHTQKTAQASTGYKRPTVVNQSWIILEHYWNMTIHAWRYGDYPYDSGQAYRFAEAGYTSGNQRKEFFGETGYEDTDDPSNYWVHPRVRSDIKADMEQCMDVGVIFVAAAGNEYHKIDVAYNDTDGCPRKLNMSDLGRDWATEYATVSRGSIKHMQGGSPGSHWNDNGMMPVCVGAIADTNKPGTTTEKKADYSNSGPRIDVWAPGTNIAGPVNAANSSWTDPRDSSYHWKSLSGTSMASPQVCGMVACLLEANPHWNQKNVRDFVRSECHKSGAIHQGTANTAADRYGAGPTAEWLGGGQDYTVTDSLHGGHNRYANMPFKDGSWTIEIT